MERKQSSNEFEALIDKEGKIEVPPEVVKIFAGSRLHVRLNREEVSSQLKARKVTEEEIERIAGVQFESREQVTKFLLSEGTLKTGKGFLRRVRGAKR